MSMTARLRWARKASVWTSCIGLLVVLGVLGGCAAPRPHPQAKTIELDELAGVLRPYMHGPPDALPPEVTNSTIRIPAGSRIPLRFSAKTPFLHTEFVGEPQMLVFDQTVYFHPARALVSCDGRTWRRIEKCGTGTFKLGLDLPGENATPEVYFALKLDDGPPSASP